MQEVQQNKSARIMPGMPKHALNPKHRCQNMIIKK